MKTTGKKLIIADYPWLDGPVGPPHKIGAEYFENLARSEDLQIIKKGKPRGILPDFGALKSVSFSPNRVHPQVIDFIRKLQNMSWMHGLSGGVFFVLLGGWYRFCLVEGFSNLMFL